MAIKKPGIPTVYTPDQSVARVLQAVKENVEILTGARPGIPEIKTLPGDAALSTVINKVNEIIIRLNASGQ